MLSLLGLVWLGIGSAQAKFVPGDVYLVAPFSPYEIYNVSAGGDVSSSVWAYATEYNAGQIAWSTDLTTMYISLYSVGQVLAVDSSGATSIHASGLSGPTGLIVLTDGTMLVSEYDSGEITDITAGGSFSGASPLSSVRSGLRNIVELDDGRVLVCNQSTGIVYEINRKTGASSTFASALGAVRTIAQDGSTGDIYAAGGNDVYDITGGGAITSADLYATGQRFFSVTVDGSGRLLAGPLGGTQLWDVTGGGDFSSASPWATGIASIESALNTVPFFPFCGDAFPEGREECDDGNADNTDDCLDDCVAATCGDSFVWAGVEDCDDGNLDDTDDCVEGCIAASCGDGYLWAGVEACDDGNLDDTDDCPTTCLTASCGDGYVRAADEACDDGNADNTDDCLDDCVAATCGDSFVWAGVEDCDDGNLDDTDDCVEGCIAASCGDGFVQAGVEACDDGNTRDGDGCAADCVIEAEPDPNGDDTGEAGDGGKTGCSHAAPTGNAGQAWLACLVSLALLVRRRRRG